MHQTLGKACHLYGEYFFAALVKLPAPRRNKRMRVDAPAQCQLARSHQFGRHPQRLAGSVCPDTGGKSGVYQTLPAQTLHINLAHHQLLLERETLGSRQQVAVFINQTVSGKHHIGCRLSETRRGKHISRQASRRLLGEQRAEISVLADILRIGRQVEDDLGSLQSQSGTGRYGRPYILANLHAEACVGRVEKNVRGERNKLAAQTDRRIVRKRGSRGKPSLLVKLFIVGKISLRNHTQYLALLEHHGTVHKHRPGRYGHADNGNDVELARVVHHLHQSELSLLEQQGLGKQIGARVARQRKFRKHHNLHALAVGNHDLLLYFLRIELAVSNLYRGNGCRNLYKTIFHIYIF